MLTIYPPEIHIDGDTARIEAVYDCDGKKNTLWFATDVKYREYLCHERADAFLVALLLHAMQQHHDIRVLASISTRLYYSLTHYMIPAFRHMRPDFKEVRITCDQLDNTLLPNAGGVGTGVSCGIDSLYTIMEHTTEDCPADYRLTHLVFFNAGSSGIGEAGRKLYRERLLHMQSFAKESGLPIIPMDSNIDDICDLPFVSKYTFSTVACALTLQKLFANYYYSSGAPVYRFRFQFDEAATYDVLSLSMLSTNDTTFFPAGTVKYRIEKTDALTNYPLSYRYLQCVHEGGA